MPDWFDDLQEVLPKRYRLERELKRGGMGHIYLARESHPDRQVAIKVLDPEVTLRLGRERFLREVSLLSNLIHPHIVPVFAAGDASGFLYYVMPFIEGETVGERVTRNGYLSLGVALRIAHDVADALAYAHQRGIIHRDIKPGNILLHDNHALVADFGIARALHVAESEPITEVGVAIGTPAYMSPEQVTGEEDVDGRTDVYSLGCVLYEMLIGEPPFRGVDTRSTMMKHVTDEPPPFEPRRTDIPVPVRELVFKALAKDRADRFESARALSIALREQGDPGTSWSGSVPTLSAATKTAPSPWSRPAAIVAAFAIVLILLWPRLFPRDSVLEALPQRWLDSLAVFPIANQTGDSTMDRVGRAISDLVVSSLTQRDSIKVSPPHSAEVLRARGLTDPQLATELGVEHLIYGTVNPSPAGLRVMIQHYDAKADALVWSTQWTIDVANEAAGEERIAAEVVSYLAGGVLQVMVQGSMSVPSLSPGHESYSMGTRFLARRTPEGIRRSIQLFRAAIGQDSTYARAYADLSVTYSLSLTYRYDIGMDGYVAAGHALAYSNRAIELDSTLSSGWAARGYLGAIAGAPIDGVVADFERARARNSSAASVASWSARVLLGQGRFDDALEQADLAVNIDPASPSRRIAVALSELQRGNYGRAIEEASVARDLESGLTMPFAIAGRARVMSGQAAQCVAMELGPHLGLRALCAGAVGDVSTAAALIDSVRTLLDVGQSGFADFTAVLAAEDLAIYYAWNDDASAALIWLENAFRLSPSGVDLQVRESALFDRVRNDPVFAQALATELDKRWGRVVAAARDVR